MNFKVYFINLDDKESTWLKAKNLFSLLPEEMRSCLERVSAIDTRKSIKKLESFNLDLSPRGLVNELYFSQSMGAVGCYLSHYIVWNKIIENKLDFALIIEDDVVLSDVVNYLMSNPIVDKSVDFLNLNGRNYENHCPLNLEGSESYVLSNSGAKKLISLTNNPSLFNDCFEVKPIKAKSKWKNENPIDFEKFKNEPRQYSPKKKSIIAPVDKFLGYSTHYNLEPSFRLSYKYFPVISLSLNESKESSIFTDPKPFDEMSNDEISYFVNKSLNYRYWDASKYSISICIATKSNYEDALNCVKECLNQDLSKVSHEIIIIDNTPDETLNSYRSYDFSKLSFYEKFLELCEKSEHIKYFHTQCNGVSEARNIGINKSSNGLVYFLDDDVELDRNIFELAIKEFSYSLKLGIVGGPVISKFENKNISNIDKNYYKFFSHVDFGNSDFYINDNLDKWLVGANLCMRKSIINDTGWFRLDLGRKGMNDLLSGEECEFINKAIRKHLVLYSSQCKVFHKVHASRDLNWLNKRIIWQSVSNILMDLDVLPPHNESEFIKKNINSLLTETSFDNLEVKTKLISHLISYLLNFGGLPNQKIPKIIHQVHLGDKPLSPQELYWQKTWKKHNPDWKHVVWTDDLVENLNLINLDAYNSCKNYSERSDILRFEILNKYGGLYVDTDFECLKPLDNFFINKDFIICKQTGVELCGAFLASTKNHPIIQKIIKGIPDRLKKFGYKDFGAETSTIKYGPVYLTELLGVEIGLDPYYVYPYLWDQPEKSNENFKVTSPKSYAVHHWSGYSLKNDFLNFKKSFVISISDKKSSKYKNLDFVEIFNGIDTRKNYEQVLNNHGVTASVDNAWRDHFYTQTAGNGSGAFGCSLSHMHLWKIIAKEKNDSDWFLILEDDVDVEDLISFKNDRTFNSNGLDLINLNNRPDPWTEFDGSDAYMITPATAKKLISFCANKIVAPVDKILFHPKYFRKEHNIKYLHSKKIRMSEDWSDSCLS